MISVLGKNWIERKISQNSIKKINQDFNLSQILSKLIISREYDLSEIYNIENDLDLKNVFSNNIDFNNGAEILIQSIKNKEKICIIGDYDVDGTVSTSLFVRYLEFIEHPYFYYIPDRFKDGYGATEILFKKLLFKKPKLIIMVDCGSTSNEAVNFLNKSNIKSIIIDHHEINKPYPKSEVIINPKKKNGYEKFDYLCAATLTYFFLDIVIKKQKSNFNLSDFLIYVLLALVCDVMPLRKLNRQIAKSTLNRFNLKKNIAFNSLFELADKKDALTINDLGYFIGPIINSGGRLGYSHYGTELLSSNDLQKVKNKSIQLFTLNNRRQKIEKKILCEIDFKKIEKENKSVIIYYNINLNEGLIGIIAARLKDYFNKPAIVITKSNNILKGSARSTINYNIGNLINILSIKKIIENGGGHNMAAGFTIKKNNIKILDDFIQKDYLKKNLDYDYSYKYDSEISSSAINTTFVKEIKKLEPFGNGNQLPTFFLKDLKIIKAKILDDKHISALLKPKNGSLINSICFNCMNSKIGNCLLSYRKDINIIAQIYENIWNNKKSIQLNIKDIFI